MARASGTSYFLVTELVFSVVKSKKLKIYIPFLLFIIAFSGFLSTQILWSSFHLNAELVQSDKQKYSAYEASFQGLKITTTKNTTIELKNEQAPIVVLNFWASWCLPCLKEFPSLVKFQEKYRGKVKVVGVNGDEEKPDENILKIENKYGLNFESVADPSSLLANKFMISSYPVSVVFLRGKVIYVNKKIHDFMDEEFLTLIDDSLKED